MKIVDDKKLEELWQELGDVLFVEDEGKRLVLSSDWLHFEPGTEREEIWKWFDKHHSNGVVWLMNDFEKEGEDDGEEND